MSSLGGDDRHGLALLNLASLLALGGPQQDAVDAASAALRHNLTTSQRDVAQALLALWDAAHEGDLDVIARLLRRLAERQVEQRQLHYAAVTQLNLALVLFWRGEAADSLRAANEAEALFLSSSRGAELGAVAAARARALAYLNRMDDARSALDAVHIDDNDVRRYELLIEGALVHCMFGSIDDAIAWLEAAGPPTGQRSILQGPWAMAAAEVALRRGEIDAARSLIEQLVAHGLGADAATLLRTQLLLARVAIREGSDASGYLASASRLSNVQHSRIGRALTSILDAASSTSGIGAAITGLRPGDRPALSLAAEELARNLHRLTPEAQAIVEAECLARPVRWRSALLQATALGGRCAQAAARMLIRVGERSDLDGLRINALRDRTLKSDAAALARRLAEPVVVQDLGPVSIQVGTSHIPGHRIRRRVLALLCFLLSRPAMAASKDEALDQLWPDLTPDSSVNSLNQTIYFLRRVFEPDYREGFSAGYVRFDGETVSLDEELISSTSQRCRQLVADARRGSPDAVRDLAQVYAGRFALDFAYEEWSVGYRDRLHASVLGVLERAVEAYRSSGDLHSAIELAQRALELEPDSDEIELVLLRLYRQSGQQAAAAEQYAHYASSLREELGIEAPPLTDI